MILEFINKGNGFNLSELTFGFYPQIVGISGICIPTLPIRKPNSTKKSSRSLSNWKKRTVEIVRKRKNRLSQLAFVNKRNISDSYNQRSYLPLLE